MSSFPSRKKYYIFLVSVLICLDVLALFYPIWFPSSANIVWNLFSEIFGIIVTIIFLTYILEYRDYKEWKNVETTVERRMGKLFYNLVNILARFIYPKMFGTHPSKEEVLKILEALNTMEKATLTKFAYDNYFPQPKGKMSIHQLGILFRYRQYLNNLEIKYSRFFKPEIQISLMEIQYHLDAIESHFNLANLFSSSQKVVEEQLPQSILKTMKEIYNTHKAGIVIYPTQS